MFVPNHLHLLVKCYIKNPPIEVNKLNDWFIRLVEKVRMKVVCGPNSVYVNEPGNEGLTGTITLATSHCSLHCWSLDTPPMIQFDIYSCSEFTVEEVIEHLDEFGLISYTYMMIDRNETNFKIISSGTKNI